MRRTGPACDVVRAMLEAPHEPVYGYQLMQKTGYGTGSLYPVLERMSAMGWIKPDSDPMTDPAERRHRRLFRFAEGGAEAAREWLERTPVRSRAARRVLKRRPLPDPET